MPNLTDQRVLYVEDDAMSREIMAMMLDTIMDASQVTIWESSQNFLEKLKALEPAPTIILLDIHIKPHNGFEMLRMVRSIPTLKGVIAIALTASVMNEEVRQLRLSGFDGAIGKPISVQTFPALLQQLVQGEAVWHIADA